MSKRKHTEESCIESLKKKNDIRIFSFKKVLVILDNKIFSEKTLDYVSNPNKHCDLGNKSLGKIDFLIAKCSYKLFHYDNFNSKDFKSFTKSF